METNFAAIRTFFRQFVGLLEGLAALQGQGDEASLREAKRRGMRLIGVTIFAGVVSALLMALVIISARQVSTPPGNTDKLLAYEYRPTSTIKVSNLSLFGLSLCALVYARRFVATESASLAESIVVGTRLRIVDQLRKAKLFQYEQAMRFEIASALNQSTAIISACAQSLANGSSAALMLVCAAGYIAYLSGLAFLLTLVCILAGIVVYSLNFRQFKQEMQQSTALDKRFAALFDHFSQGFKEVKFSVPRSEDLYHHFLAPVAREASEVRKRTARRHANFAILNESLLFLLLAVIIFIFPVYHSQGAAQVVQISAVVLFIMGPLAELVRAVPMVMLSHDAVTRIYQLEAHLSAAAEPVAPSVHFPSGGVAFEEIRLENIAFSYAKTEKPEFKLEFNEFALRTGQLVFLIGGNGSGKSTFLKLLTGLYDPDQGHIAVDKKPVSPVQLAAYRSLFSVVFTDYHLFDRLYGLSKEAIPRVRELLEVTEMSGLVMVDDDGVILDPQNGKRDVVSQLSTGQKKRLALVVALAEDKPILVLDEFAADQDPGFRRRFYVELLPAFRKNRTIIAATHDEHFFSAAHPDRVVELDFGHFRDVTSQYRQSNGTRAAPDV